MINETLLMQFLSSAMWSIPGSGGTTMSLSLLQLRLKQNEEDFARISGIDLDPNIKDVEKK